MKKTNSLNLILTLIFFSGLINAFGQYSGTGTFSKITSTADLTDGYYVIAANPDFGDWAMSNSHTGTFLTRAAITPVSEVVTDPDISIVWKIETNGAGRSIYNETIAKYVSYTGSSNNVQIVDNVTTNNQRWNITFGNDTDETDVFIFTNMGVTDRILQYNSNVGQERFAAYSSNQRKFALYKLDEVVEPEIPVVTAETFTGTVDAAASFQIQATNSPESYAIVSGTLPDGLTLDTATGIISGTPETAGDSSVDVTATNDEGTSDEATISFEIAMGIQTVTPAFEDMTKEETDTPFDLPASTDQGITLSYNSSDTDVATVSGNTITIVGDGTTTIEATDIGDTNYEAFSDSFTLTVNEDEPSGGYDGNGTFVKINSAADLTDGYYVIAANPDFGDWAMSNSHTGTFLTRAAITPVSEVVTNPDISIVWKIETNGGGKSIYNEAISKYVSYTGSSNNVQVVDNVTADNQRWNITFGNDADETDVFIFTNMGVTDRILQYNSNVSQERFACYSTNQKKYILYKLTEIVEPGDVPVITSETFTGTVDVAASFQIQATESPDSYAIASGTLPDGLTLDTATGIISGTPTTAGDSSINVTATNDEGTSDEATISFEIAMGTQTVTPAFEDITKEETDVPFDLPAATDQDIIISYNSTDTNVATVSGNTVTITGVGTTTIEATNTGDSNYEAFSESFTLTVSEESTGGGYDGNGTFVKINSIADLTDGYYVIAANPEFGDWAMSNEHTGTYLVRNAITPVSDIVTNPAVSIVWKIETNGTGKSIYNEDIAKYVSYTGSSNNVQIVDNVTADNQRWNITFGNDEDETDIFIFTNMGVTDRMLQYNSNASQERFACYTTNQKKYVLYKLTEIVEPEDVPVVTSETFNGIVGEAASFQIQATESPDSYAIVSGTLPDGLSLDTNTGIISGTPTTVGNSSVDITATNSEGTSDEATISFEIAMGTQTVTPAFEDLTKEETDAPFDLPAATDQEITLSYNSSDTDVATVSGNTVTITGVGTTTIEATNSGNSNYEPFSESFTLTVTEESTGGYDGNGIFVKINSTEDLTDGYYVIAANPEFGDWAMSNEHTGTYLVRAAIAPEDDIVTDPAVSIVWKIETNGTGKSIYNEDIAKYVSYTGSSNNVQIVDDVTADNQRWNITFGNDDDETDIFIFTNMGVTDRMLQYNSNASQERFACYSTNQKKYVLYKLVDEVEQEIPVVTSETFTGVVNLPASFQIHATNSPDSYAIVSGTLPDGLSLDTATGIISGTPTTIGNSSVDVTATNEEGTSDEATISFEITAELGTGDINSNSVQIYSHNQNIFVESKSEKIVSVELYDLQGKSIHRNATVNANNYQFRSALKGILIVRVQTQNGLITTKKIINN